MKLSLAAAAVAIACLCLFAGCGPAPDDYYPLGSGKYWRYLMTYRTMDGHFKGVYAVENLGPGKEKDRATYERRLLDGSSDFLRIDDKGIRLTGRKKADGGYGNLDHTVFQFPLVVGTEWQDTSSTRALIKTGPPQKTEFHITAEVPVTARIESLTDTVTVPAGEFAGCMRILIKGDGYTNAGNYVGLTIVKIEETDWYAPGVGLVKSIRRESTTSKALDRGEITLELEEYRP